MLGRVYVAQEGVNAQVSVPGNMMELFTATIANVPELAGVYLKGRSAARDQRALRQTPGEAAEAGARRRFGFKGI